MKIPDSIHWKSTGKTLGGGGQANVELVTHKEQPGDKLYALKALKNVGSKRARERFQREIDAIKSIDSNLIAKIIDHSAPDDTFQYYTMEYYEGAKALSDVIFTTPNPYHGDVLKSLDLFEQLISAIKVCEELNPKIVHRDINPNNILILPNDKIRLIDFGICQIDDGQIITLVDENVGTRNYTAPECEAGNDKNVSIQSDLYSAGKVLWSTITSQRAFAREEAVFGNRSLSIMFPNDGLPNHLISIFEKTIRANPTNRAQTADELLSIIASIRYLVERKFPSLLEIAKRCPSCGHNDIVDFPQGHGVFGNPNPPGVEALICRYCGFGFVRNVNYLINNYQRLLELE